MHGAGVAGSGGRLRSPILLRSKRVGIEMLEVAVGGFVLPTLSQKKGKDGAPTFIVYESERKRVGHPAGLKPRSSSIYKTHLDAALKRCFTKNPEQQIPRPPCGERGMTNQKDRVDAVWVYA
jgi:hypothetical protein